MKIFGHNLFESEKFYSISTAENILKTPSNSTVYFKKNLEIAKYCNKNSISYSVEIENIKDAIFYNILNAKFIITTPKLAIELMPIAQNYLFDSDILAKIDDDRLITKMAKKNIDGVIFLENSINYLYE